jgi:hypothetical protein
MSYTDHRTIGPNWPEDIFVGQNNGKNNGKLTITANLLDHDEKGQKKQRLKIILLIRFENELF